MGRALIGLSCFGLGAHAELRSTVSRVDEPQGSSTLDRRLLFGGPVRRIIGGFHLREPLHADGVDLGDPVLEGCPFDVILHLAIAENAFQGDELPLLESPGELG